jgi:hypothetical protein
MPSDYEYRQPSVAGSAEFVPVDEDFVIEPGTDYLVDTSGGAVVGTLPASLPTSLLETAFVDAKKTWATHNFTVARAGNPIDGNASDLVCDVMGANFGLIPVGGSIGWKITQ